jgi:hypothetical protein
MMAETLPPVGPKIAGSYKGIGCRIFGKEFYISVRRK